MTQERRSREDDYTFAFTPFSMPATGVIGGDVFARLAVLLVVVAVLYNTALAVINAHVMPITATIVVASEMLIAFCGTVLVALAFPRLNRMWPAFFLIALALITTPLVTIFQGDIYLKGFRDFYMIALFFLLGGLVDEQKLRRLFLFFGVVIATVMVMEGWMTQSYVALFEPADYFANTRGIAEREFNESGLFGASLGFEGRFSFGLFDVHRLSSVFLEQVSLGNFAIVFALFVVVFWASLSWKEKAFYTLLIAFILVTNNSRAALAMCLLLFAGGYFFAYLPRYSNVLYVPLVMILSFWLIYDPLHYSFDDTFVGRIGHTLHMLSQIEPAALLTGDLAMINVSWDSGYMYILYSQTLIGLLGFWLFTAFCVPQSDARNRRFAHGISLIIFINLMVSGATFSIKVSSPLWLMAGCLYALTLRRAATEPE